MAVVVGEAAVAVRPETSGFEREAEGKLLPAIGGVAGKATAVFAGAFAIGSAFSEALERDALQDKFAAQLGLTEQRSAEVGAAAGALYADAYGGSLEDVNTAVGAVMTSIDGMADASSGKLQEVTARALDFATAFDTDVTAATQTAGSLISTGLAANAEQAFDLMTTSFQKVPAAMREELPAILDEYGTNFAQLGFSGEEAFGMLVSAADGGAIVLDKTGDALKEFSIRATDMSESSKASYEAIGLSADDMAAAILAGGDKAAGATQEIAAGLLEIEDPVERANAAIGLFGTPLEDLGVNKIPSFLQALASGEGQMEGFAGASDRMGQTLNDNASTNLTSFGRQAQQLAIDFLGGQLLPALSDLSGFVSTQFGPAVSAAASVITGDVIPAVQSLAGWVTENQTPILVIAGLIAAVFIPHLIALAVQSGITKVQAAAAWTVQKAGAIQAAVVHSAQIALMIGRWIALGVTAVAQGIVTAAVWTGSIVASAVAGAASFAVQVARVVAGFVLMAVQAGIQGAIMAASVAVTVASVVAGWVLMGVQSMIQAARMAAAWLIAMGPIGIVIALVIGVVALIIANWEKVKAFTVGAFQAVVGAVTGAFRSVVSGVSSGISAVVSFFTGLPGRILSALSGLGSLLVGTGKSLIQGLVNGISGAAGFVGDIAGNIWSAIRGFVNSNLIDRLNGLLDFTIAGVHINVPDIPRLHSGGVFTSGSSAGEGLALLRDQERVITPQQRQIADGLLTRLLDGSLSAPAGTSAAAPAPVQVVNNVTQQPGESGTVLAARVSAGTVWSLNHRITRRTGDAAVEPAR